MVKLKRVNEVKKVVKRSLPITNYKIIDTYFTAEPEIVCDNCGKAISNVAQIKSEDGKTYLVGMDCAATLSGISEEDIEYWNNSFKQAKAIRAKLRKFLKEGGTWKPFVPWYRDDVIYSLLKYDSDCDGKLLPYYVSSFSSTPYVSIERGNHFNSFEDVAKYLLDIAESTLINPAPKTSYLDESNISDRDSIPKSGSLFRGFKLEYKPATEEDLSYYIKIYKGGELWLGRNSKTYSNLSMYSKINKGQRMDVDEANAFHIEDIKYDIIRMLNVCIWYKDAISLREYLNR